MKRIVIIVLGCCLSAAAQPTLAQVADTLSVKVDSMQWSGGVEVSIPVKPTTSVRFKKDDGRHVKDSRRVYDLQGRRIKLGGRKGLYIIDGQKVVR